MKKSEAPNKIDKKTQLKKSSLFDDNSEDEDLFKSNPKLIKKSIIKKDSSDDEMFK